MEHTLGPWKKRSQDLDVTTHPAIRVLSADGKLVAIARAAGGPLKEANANARLIAAAPDLLAALKELTKHAEHILEKNGLPHDDAMMMLALIDQANAVIAKS